MFFYHSVELDTQFFIFSAKIIIPFDSRCTDTKKTKGGIPKKRNSLCGTLEIEAKIFK